MSLFLKSITSLILLAQAILALYTMLEARGREKSRFNPRVLRLTHRVNGYIFGTVLLVVSYYCFPFLRGNPGEISARALSHSLFAIGVILMLSLKILFIRTYRKFMDKVPSFGLTIFFLSVGLVATSGGYYFAVSAEMRHTHQQAKTKQTKEAILAAGSQKPDKAKVQRGEKLFNKWCLGCHEAHSNAQKTGPGLKGVLKQEKLSVSRRVATPENIYRQLRTPYMFMPPQTHLTDEEIEQIIEFLKTI